jgi:murein L,D-transpeptidase YcbB/YkuD
MAAMESPDRAVADRRALLRLLGAAGAALALPGCVGADRPAPPPAAPPPPPASAFQRALDAIGAPLRLPPQGKAIVVNVPAFELIAFEDATPVFRSRVIVGTPENQTPLMQTHVRAVTFRPTWRPTPDMVASGEYRDRVWPAGPRNPLGLAAVRLEPGLLVYLHDTNRRDLFERDARALSHGCVRVQRWATLVAWILDIPEDEVRRHAEGARTFDMPAASIPVTLGYYTVFPDDAGNPETFADVYGLG